MHLPSVAPFGRALRIAVLALAVAFGMAIGGASTSYAQDADLEDVLGGIGQDRVDDSAEPGAGEGTISGQIFDGASGLPLGGVTIIVLWPATGDGSERRQDVVVSDDGGFYEFGALPAGTYDLDFIKSGYRASKMQGFEVVAGVDNTADFPMPPVPTDAAGGGEVLDLEAFVVEASTVGEIMAALELRLESDQLLNILSAEDLSKFAASDVADALKRVAGVNIVEGQFAIIRGLEERYSSTLFNGAPVPSPDPDRQSVQLDLFPSDIVSSLEIAKTFAPESPSNSSGGSVDIATSGYPDTWTMKVSGGGGYHDRARREFLEYQENGGGGGPSPIGRSIDDADTNEYDVSAFLGGRQQLLGREVRLVASYSEELDFSTTVGQQQDFEPARFRDFPPSLARSGDLALGQLNLPGALWDLTQSTRQERTSWFFAGGLDLDTDGLHKVDATIFLTRSADESVERRENGRFPADIYAPLRGRSANEAVSQELIGRVAFSEWVGQAREDASTPVGRGQLWYAPVFEGRTFDRERELDLYQLNGEHDLGEIPFLEGLSLDWAANYATTRQEETQFNVRSFFEPDDAEFIEFLPPGSLPLRVDQLTPGQFSTRPDIVFGINEIDEDQIFGRADLEYAFEPLADLVVNLNAGVWYEFAERDVESRFSNTLSAVPGRPGVLGAGTIFAIQGRTIEEMGSRVFRGVGLDSPLDVRTSEGEREILAGHFGGKFTFFEDLDLLGGVRLEQLRIESNNDPFTGLCTDLRPTPDNQCAPGEAPIIFPSVYVLFDRLDNPSITDEMAFAGVPGLVNNDELVGITVTPDPATGFVDYRDAARINEVVNGEIDEFYTLPSLGFTYRFDTLSQAAGWTGFLEGLVLRGGYSETVARPSFRELGYYASLRSGEDQILLGNPQLQPSEVTSYDLRFEYSWNDYGDLFAVSGFIKDIENPIETVTVRDPFGIGIDTYRTFRNNPSDADLLGVELEGRLTLGVFSDLLEPLHRGNDVVTSVLDALSVGGNYTYIDAEVEQPPELRRALVPFFQARPQEAGQVQFFEYERTRRLTNQPEWIANADVSFDHPDWLTKVTLSIFAISDVLDSTAATDFNSSGALDSFQLDRYTDSFYQLDLVVSQGFAVPYIPGIFTVKGSAKNLTDSRRAILYDREQTVVDIEERRFKVGRDYSFALSYEIELGGVE
ncbi:MAG: TonB-dependent receptor [Myxococcota bacterium]